MAALPQIIARVRRVFDLAADPDTIGAHLALDPALAPLVAARPGLRVPGAWDGFELAVRAIFGQQITVPAATKLLGKLVQAHGDPLPAARRTARASRICFRQPTRIAAADLAALGMPGARAMAVTSLAQAIAADPAIFSRGASLEEAIAKLRALPGIGEWTAQYIAMRELREPDAFPAADIGLLRAMADGGWPPSVAGGIAVARRALAAVARLCGAASVGRRHRQPLTGKTDAARSRLKSFSLDRLQTPIGTALLVTDADGMLRALDWEEHEPRMKELLRLQYGACV